MNNAPSPIVADFVGLWSMILIGSVAWSIFHYIKRKNVIGVIFGMIVGLCDYFLFEMAILPFHVDGAGNLDGLSYSAYVLDTGRMTLIVIFTTIANIIMAFHSIYDWYSKVTVRSIKYCTDAMPVGICYYTESGKVILSNACMKRINYEITGRALLNAFDFTESLKDEYITLENGTVWKTEIKEKNYKGFRINEILCMDVSELIEKKRSLEVKNHEVELLNRKLKDYHQNIDEYIKQKEILKAKMDIHDEMNRLMLMTVAAIDSADDDVLDNVLASWNINAGIISSESKRAENDYKNVLELAQMLGIKLTGEGNTEEIPEEYMDIYCVIAREALVNASKHSKAESLRYLIDQNDIYLRVTFENDIDMCENTLDINLLGGLNNLRRLIEGYKGSISVEKSAGKFVLIVELPKGGDSYGLQGIGG